ncbi:MAG: hypothetical protein ABSH28_01575 [Acidobacteriota bacterium]
MILIGNLPGLKGVRRIGSSIDSILHGRGRYRGSYRAEEGKRMSEKRKRVNAKRKGTRNEHKAIRALEDAGYHCTRSAGSLGLFDIIAIGRQGIRLVQVKTNEDARPHEREQIQMFDGIPPGATKEVWIYQDYARKPVIKVL